MIVAVPESPGPLIKRTGRRGHKRPLEGRFAPKTACGDVIIFGSETKDLP